MAFLVPSFGFARIDHTGVPEIVARCGDGSVKVEFTVGDGNCAIRSVVGEHTPNVYFHRNASGFVCNTFGPTFATFTARLKDSVLLEELKQVLWLELVKPRAAAVEEGSGVFRNPSGDLFGGLPHGPFTIHLL